MSRASRQAQPAPRRVCVNFVDKLARKYEHLDPLFVRDDSQVRFRLPAFELHNVRETVLLVERRELQLA